MSFIAILLSIIIETFFRQIDRLRHFKWFSHLTDWIVHQLKNTSAANGAVAVLIIISPTVLAVGLFDWILDSQWVGFSFIFSVLVLSYSLGPVDPFNSTQGYLDAIQNEDAAGAAQHVEDLLGTKNNASDILIAQEIKETLPVQLYENILGVFFWFVLLGPVGAIMYRLSCILKERFDGTQSGFSSAADDLYRILVWIPARLSVIAFALVGNFIDTFQSLNGIKDLWKRDSKSLAVESALGALHLTSELDDDKPDIDGVVHILALCKRAIIVWITVLGLLVIAGWTV